MKLFSGPLWEKLSGFWSLGSSVGTPVPGVPLATPPRLQGRSVHLSRWPQEEEGETRARKGEACGRLGWAGHRAATLGLILGLERPLEQVTSTPSFREVEVQGLPGDPAGP